MNEVFDDFDTQIQSDELAILPQNYIFIDEDLEEEDYLKMYKEII